MQWHWKVRIYNSAGDYGIGQIATARDLEAINVIQDFYETLTGFKMLLEGMSEQPFGGIPSVHEIFQTSWRAAP